MDTGSVIRLESEVESDDEPDDDDDDDESDDEFDDDHKSDDDDKSDLVDFCFGMVMANVTTTFLIDNQA